jgi:chromosomal replication initiator protein
MHMSQQQAGKLDPHFTFSRFTVNSINHTAVETCHIVATHPGLAYNPLFLYGSANTGKTHLIQAIGNQIHADNPTLKIVYLSCKQLMLQSNAVAPASGLQTTRSRYQHIDIMLLDDFEHLAGYTALQHELSYLINVLHRAGKQIVIVADRAPQALTAVIDHLRVRCMRGLVVAMPSSA